MHITQNNDRARHKVIKQSRIKRNKRAGKHLEINGKKMKMKRHHRKKKNAERAAGQCEGLQTCNKL